MAGKWEDEPGKTESPMPGRERVRSRWMMVVSPVVRYKRTRWSPGKHAPDGCLWRGVAQGRPGCSPFFQVHVRWEMSDVQGGSGHSWPREAQGSHLGPERQRLCLLPSFCLAVFMSLHLIGHQLLQFGSRTHWSVLSVGHLS